MEEKKIGVLFIGLNGATGNTTVIGSKAILKGLGSTYGMLTETPLFSNIDLVNIEQFIFGGWDINYKNAYQAGIDNRVIRNELLERVKEDIIHIYPMKAVVTRYDIDLSPEENHIKDKNTLEEYLHELIDDIKNFKQQNNLDETIIVNLSSTQKYSEINRDHETIENFMKAISMNKTETITSGMIYALAAIETNSPFVDFTPNRTLEAPALQELAKQKGVPIAGKDGSTGETLIKTVIAHMLKIRNLKLIGWYSTNLIGNNDGRILSIPEHSKTKMIDKLRVLEPILGYSDFEHLVDIKYYLPRGDNKEAWENIDFIGWLNEPMCLKINWLGKDSILAAPLIIDLIRLLEYSHRIGESGIQKQLSIYFKHPIGTQIKGFFDQYKIFESYYINKG